MISEKKYENYTNSYPFNTVEAVEKARLVPELLVAVARVAQSDGIDKDAYSTLNAPTYSDEDCTHYGFGLSIHTIDVLVAVYRMGQINGLSLEQAIEVNSSIDRDIEP